MKYLKIVVKKRKGLIPTLIWYHALKVHFVNNLLNNTFEIFSNIYILKGADYAVKNVYF
jgi:hypothetical protein